ncbi:MAG TPA: sigma-70 family RNA polymerase sigma factor [Gaiellaceae bacterium]|nr:sigma-70 family RNA polymerase sigma factor [Gaiellaceae bacterium]
MCDAHTAAVLAYALRRTSREDAADVVAETFLVLWRRLDDVDEASALPWLYAVARRVLLAQRRATRRQHAIAQRVAGSAPYFPEVSSGSNRLFEALAELGEKEREVLMLAAWEELSSSDAARVVGCSATAYRIRLHRARRRLRERLDQPERLLKESPSC